MQNVSPTHSIHMYHIQVWTAIKELSNVGYGKHTCQEIFSVQCISSLLFFTLALAMFCPMYFIISSYISADPS